MIDVNKLLTAVLAGGAAPSERRDDAPREGAGFGRPQNPAPGEGGRGAPGGVGDFLSRNAGLLGGGALAGGLAGVLLNSKHARKYAGSALQVGAAAVLGGLAYKAYQDYRAGRPLLPQSLQDAIKGLTSSSAGGSGGGEIPRIAAGAHDRANALLLRAMIAAALADGRIDETERKRLIDRVEASELAQDERAFLEEMIARPDSAAKLAADVKSPEEAAQVYLAAVVAIDADTAEERAWLDDLATRLSLEPQLRDNIEAAARGALDQAA